MQAEDGIRDLVRSRGLGDVYKRQSQVDVRQGGDAARVVQNQIGIVTTRKLVGKQGIDLSLIHI